VTPPAVHAAPSIQRKAVYPSNVVQCRGANPKKPKYLLSEFAVEVQQTVADHFHIPRKAFRLKEHHSSDFIVSAVAQEVLFKKIEDPILSLDRERFEREHPDISLSEIAASVKDVNGLTTEEISGSGDAYRIVHVRQVENSKKMKCTLIHEALHAYSHNGFKVRCGKDLDEGVTELLAMEVIKAMGLSETRDKMGVYKTERTAATAYIRQHGIDNVKAAYFNGTFAAGMP
jgi:hypothetical protein